MRQGRFISDRTPEVAPLRWPVPSPALPGWPLRVPSQGRSSSASLRALHLDTGLAAARSAPIGEGPGVVTRPGGRHGSRPGGATSLGHRFPDHVVWGHRTRSSGAETSVDSHYGGHARIKSAPRPASPPARLIAIAVQVLWATHDVATRQLGFLAVTAASAPVYVYGWLTSSSMRPNRSRSARCRCEAATATSRAAGPPGCEPRESGAASRRALAKKPPTEPEPAVMTWLTEWRTTASLPALLRSRLTAPRRSGRSRGT